MDQSQEKMPSSEGPWGPHGGASTILRGETTSSPWGNAGPDTPTCLPSHLQHSPRSLLFLLARGTKTANKTAKLLFLFLFFFFKDVPSLWLPWQHLLASLKSALSSLHGLSSLPHCALLLHTPALALPISAPPWAPPPPPGQASSLGMAQAGAEEDFRGTQSTGR